MASIVRLKLPKPAVLPNCKTKDVKLVAVSPKVADGRIPSARSADTACCAVVLVAVNPVAEAKFLKAAVLFDHPFTAELAEVLLKFNDVPMLLVLTPIRVVHPAGKPLLKELKSCE